MSISSKAFSLIQGILVAKLSVHLVGRLNQQLDYSHCNSQTLLGQHSDALRVSTNKASTPQDLNLAEAVLAATTSEMMRRVERNFANSSFGLLLLGHVTGDRSMERDSYERLHKLAFGILKQNWPGYARHSEHPTVWTDCVTDVVVEELAKHRHLQPLEVWERILDNGFAYLYTAFKRQFQDEWRGYLRHRGRTVSISQANVSGQSKSVNPEEQESIAQGFEEQAAKHAQSNPGLAAILMQYASYERDPDGWEALYGHFPTGVSKALAANRGVGIRQAQRNAATLRGLAQRDTEFQRIRERLKDVVKQQQNSAVMSLSRDEHE
jgi:hypothetical protein